MAACPNCKVNLQHNLEFNEGGFSNFSDIFPEIEVHSTGYTEMEEYPQQCSKCGLPMKLECNDKGEIIFFKYPGDLLLALQNRQAFLDWKIKQLNGWVSVSLLTRASCSIVGNLGAIDYTEFLRETVSEADLILDVGCGNQQMPSYFTSSPMEAKTIIGLDPFPSSFSGSLVIGVAEFIPLKDSIVDVVNCASTIDHFMNLDLSLSEIERVIKPGGVLSIWDHSGNSNHDLHPSLKDRLHGRFKKNQMRKFRLYANGIVFRLDDDYDDPFHAIESRETDWSRRLFSKLKFLNFDLINYNEPLGYSLWKKPN